MKTFWSTLTIVILALGSLAGAQEQAGQPCHNNKKDPLFGLYCPTINGSFVGPKNGSQLNTTTVINGVITPITGTLTFAPGPNETPVVDDYDDSGNPICYQYNSNGKRHRDDYLSVGCILRHHAVGHHDWRSSPGPQPTRLVGDELVLRQRLQQQLQDRRWQLCLLHLRCQHRHRQHGYSRPHYPHVVLYWRASSLLCELDSRRSSHRLRWNNFVL
jgi:hypothetical protein